MTQEALRFVIGLKNHTDHCKIKSGGGVRVCKHLFSRMRFFKANLSEKFTIVFLCPECLRIFCQFFFSGEKKCLTMYNFFNTFIVYLNE